MNRIRSFGNLHKKSKDAASGDGSDSSKNNDGWRGKRPSALLLPPKAGYGGVSSRKDSQETGASKRLNASQSTLGLEAPCLPPLLLSLPSAPEVSRSSTSPLSSTSGESKQEIFSSPSSDIASARAPADEFLSLPKPAFLAGGRTGGSRGEHVCGNSSFNASTSSLPSSLLSTTSSQSAEMVNHKNRSKLSVYAPRSRHSGREKYSSSEQLPLQESPSKAGVRDSLRTIGRRFLPTKGSTMLNKPYEQEDLSRRSPSLRIDLPSPGSDTSNNMPATPSLSSTSASHSSSSCTSLVNDSPRTPTSAGLPTLLPAAVPVSKMKGSPLSETVRRGNWPPQSPSIIMEEPVTIDSSAGTSPAALESSDFLQAVLNFCTTDNDVESTVVKSIPTSYTYSYTYPTATAGKPGQKRMTQMDAAKLLEEERARRAKGKKGQQRFAYRSPWAVQEEEDSEDEYGGEDDVEEAPTTIPVPSKETPQAKPTGSLRVSGGLDTAAKKAMYACTVMKFHPQLATGLNLGISGTEVRHPRSVNSATTLQGHPSSSSHTRSMRIGLARSKLIRRLRTQALPLSIEQELEWFARKYLPHYIAPEQLASHLAQKAAENSLEALVRPPLAQGKENGMALWAGRPSYAARCDTIEDYEVTAPFGKEYTIFYDCDVHIPHPMPLQLSQRCRALAGVSAEEAGKGSGKKGKKSGTGPRRLAPPWMKAPDRVNSDPSPVAGALPPSDILPTANENSPERERPSHEKKKSDDSNGEEDVPLAMLLDRRGERGPLERRATEPFAADAGSPSQDFHAWQMQLHMERERANRRQRELQLIEDQKRLLEKARERRQKQYQMNILKSPTYGAGDPLFDPKHGRATEPVSLMSPSRSPKRQPSGSPAKSPPMTSDNVTGRASPLLAGLQSRPSSRFDEQHIVPDWRLSHANLAMMTASPPAASPSMMSMSQGYPTMGGIPHMIPTQYGIMPMSNSVVLSPSYYPSPVSHRNSTMQPLVSLSPEQIPTSARRFRVNVEC